jgi:hypothetical protein
MSGSDWIIYKEFYIEKEDDWRCKFARDFGRRAGGDTNEMKSLGEMNLERLSTPPSNKGSYMQPPTRAVP